MRQPRSRSRKPQRLRAECDGRYIGLVSFTNGLFYAALVFRPNASQRVPTPEDAVVPGCTRAFPDQAAARRHADRKARSFTRWMREYGARRELEDQRRAMMRAAADSPVFSMPAAKRQSWPSKPVLL